MIEELLTVEELADLLEVPASWIYQRTRWRGRERLPHIKMGKYLRFEERAILGLRRSELSALRWGAVDLEKGKLEVRESVYNGHFSTPKTRNSARQVPLSSHLVAPLKDRKARQTSIAPEDFVFPSRRGTSIRPDSMLKRVIHPACNRLKMPRVGRRTFRHTHATLLNELGENPKTAQAILGHSDLETTMQTHTHAVPETMIRAEERLARCLLDSNGPKLKETEIRKAEEGVWIQYERPERS